ncbi:family 20 glycosylhydrolase [Oceanobacillus neutriphilus]|uniref:N-acetyl-beta-D-glucosaminidase n=1 Tax=Oceanobacillus neutriphilus TaxID=531815 RepID=A0ABQ2NSX6_9BACI|nr:family 20 glycosylhydrolase [Oceanobacillus neutriphilus]GGP10018.1 N-acetyl-beta-D-glucosaminidase [Oceanobacillus neutriphilus]
MDILFKGDVENLRSGIEELQDAYGFTVVEQGGTILTGKQDDHVKGLIVEFDKGAGMITYQQPCHFFRALGLVLEALSKGNKQIHIQEEMQFSSVGPMFDLSRNMTMKLSTLKDFIRKLAVMGHNAAMLYMEDTYEVEGEPYFGYMRGRYSEKELRELDDYANQFGIELIPCIQTLAHLEEFLKWDAAYKYKDTRGALLLESDDTYDLLDRMIAAATKPFRSNRIHIGMDEAEEVGRGRYLNINGFKNRFDLMKAHLDKIVEITDKYHLHAIMWSDMFLKLASETGDSYDKTTDLPEYIVNQLPDNVQYMYWQYAQADKEHYGRMLQQLKRFGSTPAFAGGMWVWNTFAPNYQISLAASEPALNVCKQEGIEDVFVTLWGDDGYENNVFNALYGLQYYAEHAYHPEIDTNHVKERALFCTGIDPEALLALNKMDQPPGVDEGNTLQTNPSKFLLWQDVLLGLFDKHVEKNDAGAFYEQLAEEIRQYNQQTPGGFFDVPEKLCRVLAKKGNLGVELKAAYDAADREKLQDIAGRAIPEVIERVKTLQAAHRKQWLSLNKPFGWEVIDIRYGGLLQRLDTACVRIDEYLKGDVDEIDELEQERLYYSPNVEESSGLGWCSYYYRMASPNVFFHVLPIY